MKILIITNNVKNVEAMKQGLQIAKDHASTIGYNFEFDFQNSTRVFSGITFNNQAVGSGACVKPEEILQEVNGNYKIACLIFDWDKVLPKPTNPVQSPILKNGCNPIQIPENWYNNYPEVLSDYFLHELCHSGYFFANNVAGDQTHAYPAEFGQKQRWEYYLHLLGPLKQYLEQPATVPVTIDPTLRRGDKKPEVSTLQQILKNKGFYTYGFITGYFGPITESAVRSFQKARGLFIDGVVGPRTWDALKKKLTLRDVLIKIESNGDDNAIGDLTLKNKAYGCLQIRQGVCDDINKKFGTKYKAQDCLGNRLKSLEIWDKYWLVYPEKTTDEDRAKTWNGGPAWKKYYGKPGYEKYTKNLDTYYTKVKKLLV